MLCKCGQPKGGRDQLHLRAGPSRENFMGQIIQTCFGSLSLPHPLSFLSIAAAGVFYKSDQVAAMFETLRRLHVSLRVKAKAL